MDAVALARAILSLAEALGLDTVAEGIEVDAQRDTLLELGCKTGQGYSFGKAMPVDEVLDAAVTRRRSLLAGNMPGQIEYSRDRPVPRDHRERLTPVSPRARLHYITPGMVLIIGRCACRAAECPKRCDLRGLSASGARLIFAVATDGRNRTMQRRDR